MLKTKAILKDSPIFSTFAVADVTKAKAFYGDTLGLDVRDGAWPPRDPPGGDRPRRPSIQSRITSRP